MGFVSLHFLPCKAVLVIATGLSCCRVCLGRSLAISLIAMCLQSRIPGITKTGSKGTGEGPVPANQKFLICIVWVFVFCFQIQIADCLIKPHAYKYSMLLWLCNLYHPGTILRHRYHRHRYIHSDNTPRPRCYLYFETKRICPF